MRLMDYFYAGQYSSMANENSDYLTKLTTDISLHIAMYGLADKYNVKGLENVAVRSYQSIFIDLGDSQHHIKLQCFVDTLPKIWETTSENARLRRVAMQCAAKNIKQLLSDSSVKPLFQLFCEQTPRFLWCVLNMSHDSFCPHQPDSAGVKCSDCANKTATQQQPGLKRRREVLDAEDDLRSLRRRLEVVRRRMNM